MRTSFPRSNSSRLAAGPWALALAACVAATGCRDFQKAYDDCVTRGTCVPEEGPIVLGPVDPGVSTVAIDRPTGVTADGVDAARATVTLRDAEGHLLPNVQVELSATGTQNTLTQPPVTDSAGSAAGRITSTVAETKTLTVVAVLGTGERITLSARPTVRFEAGPATTVAFVSEPGDGTAGEPFSPPVRVGVVDAKGNVVLTASNPITVSLGAGPSGATLEGTRTITAVNGVATFDDLYVSAPGSGYALIALSAGLPPTSSRAFSRTAASPDAAMSTATVSPATVFADGTSAASLVVTVRNAQGQVLRNQLVSATASGTGNSFTPASARTDASGIATLSLTSTVPGEKVLTVRVDPGTGSVLLATQPRVTFTPALPQVANVSLTNDSGCIGVQYSVSQLQSLPVDVRVEYAGSSTDPFSRATQAGSTTADGVTGVRASSSGLGHRFLWNSTADLPRRSTLDARMRITASVAGVPGPAAEVSFVAVRNAPNFVTEATPEVGQWGSEVVAGDFNTDGKMDVVSMGNSQYAVLLGHGDGGYAAPLQGAVSNAWLRGPSTGDFNNDGKLDIAYTMTDGGTPGGPQLGMLRGNGDGTFTNTLRAIPFNPYNSAAADFNRDGRMDVVTNNPAGNGFVYFPGVGDGTFGATPVTVNVGLAPSSLAAADLNRDGRMDVASVGPGAASLKVSLGDGAGGFGAALSSSTGAAANLLRMADLNGDGVLDAALVSDTELRVAIGRGDGTFNTAVSVATATLLRGLAVADFDGDGRLDLLAGRPSTDGAILLRGNGDGTFQPALPIAFGDINANAHAVVATELTGDGLPDAVFVSSANSSTTVFSTLNRQPARCEPVLLGPASALESASSPFSVDVGDFNQDGKPDLASANRSGGSVSVALGRGNGTFGIPTLYTANSFTKAVRTADLNGDGRLDLVSANYIANSVSVLLGSVGGTFLNATDYPVATLPEKLALADVNGDGKVDIVTVSSNNPGRVSVLLGIGNGTFNPAQGYDAGLGVEALALLDADSDGRLDVVTANRDADSLALLRGLDGGTLLQPPVLTSPVDDPTGVTPLDFDTDGRMDLAVSHAGDGGVELFRNNGGSFQTIARYATTPAGTPPGCYAPAVADWNGDGRPDLMVPNINGGSAAFLAGLANGGFAAPTHWYLGSSLVELTSADFDGDGVRDVAASDIASGFTVTSSNGDGTFKTAHGRFLSAVPVDAVTGDFNRDGRLDVAALSSDAVHVLLGNGDGTLQAPVLHGPAQGLGPGTGSNAQDLAAGDFNGDGILDLVSANRDTSSFSLMRGAGGGAFMAATSTTVSGFAFRVVPGDYNNDGKLDVAVGHQSFVSVFPGTGTGTFGTAVVTTTSSFPASLVSGDFNNDGRLDLALSETSSSQVKVLIGNGAGGFTVQPAITGISNSSLTAGDFDRNGKLDLAVSTGNNTLAMRILTGNGTGAFTAGSGFNAGNTTRAASVADVNGDGIPDLSVALFNGSGVSVLHGNGNGTFTWAQTYALTGRGLVALTGDFDSDGRVDVVGVADDRSVTLLRARY